MLLLPLAALAAAPLVSPPIPAPHALQADGPPPVLRVGDRVVDLDEFDDWIVRDRAPVLLRDFARHALLRLEAERRGIEVDDEEVSALVRTAIDGRIRSAFGGRREEWLQEVRSLGRTERGLLLQRRVEVRDERLLEELLLADRSVPEEAVSSAWEREYGPKGRHVEYSLILCEVPGRSGRRRGGPDEAALAEARARADGLAARLRAGADFATLARRESDDSATRRRGGKAADDFSVSGWPSDAMQTVEALEPGEVSEPVLGPRGWWIVRSDGIVETPFESVREELLAELESAEPGAEERRNYLDALLAAHPTVELEALHALPGPLQSHRPPDEVVLRLGEDPITRREFATWLRRTRGEDLAPRYALAVKIRELAAEAGISVTEEEVLEQVEVDRQTLIDENFGGDLDAWQMDLTSDGRTEESFRRELAVRLRTNLLAEQLIVQDRVVPENVARAEWSERYGEEGRSTFVRFLTVRADPGELSAGTDPEEVQARIEAAIDEAEERARELRVRVVEGGEDFGALAREHSDDDATRETGGDPGERFRAGEWSPKLGEAVAGAEVGEVAGPVWLSPVWVLIEVRERRETPFEEVREELLEELRLARPTETDLAAFRNVTMRTVDYELLDGLYL